MTSLVILYFFCSSGKSPEREVSSNQLEKERNTQAVNMLRKAENFGMIHTSCSCISSYVYKILPKYNIPRPQSINTWSLVLHVSVRMFLANKILLFAFTAAILKEQRKYDKFLLFGIFDFDFTKNI